MLSTVRVVIALSISFWSQDWRSTWRDFAPKQLPQPGMRLDDASDLTRRYVVKSAREMIERVKRT
jgi:hypothetical protein